MLVNAFSDCLLFGGCVLVVAIVVVDAEDDT